MHVMGGSCPAQTASGALRSDPRDFDFTRVIATRSFRDSPRWIEVSPDLRAVNSDAPLRRVPHQITHDAIVHEPPVLLRQVDLALRFDRSMMRHIMYGSAVETPHLIATLNNAFELYH